MLGLPAPYRTPWQYALQLIPIEEIFNKCIRHKLLKININKVLNHPYIKVWQKKVNKALLIAIIKEVIREIQKVVKSCINILGSAGKA